VIFALANHLMELLAMKSCFKNYLLSRISLSTTAMLVGYQEGHLACESCCYSSLKKVHL